MLERSHLVLEVAELEVGVVGTKGFVGGFPGAEIPDFGEPLLRQVYAETTREVEALEAGLEAVAGCDRRLVLLHYAPVSETIVGEPEGIWAFLGSGRLAGPIGAHRPDVVFHGHAHHGRRGRRDRDRARPQRRASGHRRRLPGASSCDGDGPANRAPASGARLGDPAARRRRGARGSDHDLGPGARVLALPRDPGDVPRAARRLLARHATRRRRPARRAARVGHAAGGRRACSARASSARQAPRSSGISLTVVGLALALWTTTSAATALMDGITTAFDGPRSGASSASASWRS